MIYVCAADTWDNVIKWILGGFRLIFFYLDEVIYGLIIDLYNIFRWICGARIADSQAMNELASRVGLILGLIMFFYISFDFIQVLLDPDKLTDKEKGPLNIIKKFLIVIVLLGTSRYIFDLLYNFQSIVLSNDDGNGSIIEKLILPYSVNTSNFGNAIATNFMITFYKVDDSFDYEIDESGNVDLKGTTDQLMNNYKYSDCILYTHLLYEAIANTGDFASGRECVAERYNPASAGGQRFFIDFNILSVLVGLFVAWILITYTVSVGIRVVQLIVLQIVSPAAIICYLSPSKDNTFSKWLKLYFSTYIDVFIRIAIIDFVVLLCGLILERSSLASDYTAANNLHAWIVIFMVMALLSFAKKAPELFKKLLPEKLQSGLDFGFGGEGRAGLGFLGGAIAGGLTGLIGGAIGAKSVGDALLGMGSGLVSGTGRGLLSGAKGKNLRDAISGARSSQANANFKAAQRVAAGGSRIPSPFSKFAANTYDREKTKLEDENKILSQYASSYDTINSRIQSKIDDGSFNDNQHVQEKIRHNELADVYRHQLQELKGFDENGFAKQYFGDGPVDLEDQAYQTALANARQSANAAYEAEKTRLNDAIVKEMNLAKEANDAAKEDYYREKQTEDSVLADAIFTANDLIANNASSFGDSRPTTSSYGAFKAASGRVNTRKTENNAAISENTRRGERARANAKYSGKG